MKDFSGNNPETLGSPEVLSADNADSIEVLEDCLTDETSKWLSQMPSYFAPKYGHFQNKWFVGTRNLHQRKIK